MTIYQLLLDLTPGDAISNDALSLESLIISMGYASRILALKIDPVFENKAELFTAEKISTQDIVIYHESVGGKLSRIFRYLNCRKILRYHNITPGFFFKPYRLFLAFRLEQGRKQLRRLAACTDYSIPVSSYNASELIEAGFDKNRIRVLPVLINFDGYGNDCDKKLLTDLKSESGARLLFTGRISPNKKIEDVIKIFYYYKTFIDSQAKLYLVGSTRASEKYFAKLKGFVADLKLENVCFTGHIPFEQLLSYYRAADIFLCMSEHEGFCVPLIEAMYFNIPIVAYASSAIPETLGGSGVLLKEKDFIEASESIRELMQNSDYRKKIIEEQKQRLKYFTSGTANTLYKKKFLQIFETL